MGYNTKIDWCDTSWNPVTGCYHKCEYCYARGLATRFAGFLPEENPGTWGFRSGGILVELDRMQARKRKDGKIVPAPYPYGFTPTLHRYRLDEPKKWTEPRTIFVCSMADLFGEWVPDEWVKAVFDACDKAPQHRYLFLTKNPARYISLSEKGMLPSKHWYGYSATTDDDLWTFHHADDCPVKNLFVSVEPIHDRLVTPFSTHCPADWVIIGAETGNCKNKIIPKRSWITEIADHCEMMTIPVFMKESVKELMGSDFKQQYPWEVHK